VVLIVALSGSEEQMRLYNDVMSTLLIYLIGHILRYSHSTDITLKAYVYPLS
jgi:hypothetical protein